MSDGYQEDVHSTAVRAGKRTYFFDVKATRGNDLYLSITESKKQGHEEDGNVFYEKHKLFLYKEDFENFMAALDESMTVIRDKQGKDGFRSAESLRKAPQTGEDAALSTDTSDISFDQLGSNDETETTT